MRLVVEVTEAERAVLLQLTAELGTTYSALLRSLVGLAAVDLAIRKSVAAALAAPRQSAALVQGPQSAAPVVRAPGPETEDEHFKRLGFRRSARALADIARRKKK